MIRVLPGVAVAVVCLLAPSSCSSTEAAPPPLHLSGEVQAEVFRVPAGETVWVDADLTVFATTAIVIEGRLVARDAAELGRQDAPAIELVCPLVIDVPGELLGGRGSDSRISQGGSGSSLVLRAPLVRVHGRVEAGDGGAGGRSLAGGRGGDALVHGRLEGGSEEGHVALHSGTGGTGGAPGGAVGPTGAAFAEVPPEVDEAWAGLQPQIDEVLRSLAGKR